MNGNWLNKIASFAKKTPQRKALGVQHEAGQVEWLTYKQLYHRALIAAHHLLCSGLEAGDRVLLMCPTSLDFAVAFLGCMLSGIIAVPLYAPRSNRKADRVLAVAADCDAKAVIGRFNDTSVNLGAILDSVGIRAAKIDSLELFNSEPSFIHLPKPPSLNDIAFLQYTSGSTGTPKGVMVTHANLTHNLAIMGERSGFDASSCFVSWLPIYHDMGLILGFLEPLSHGVKNILMPPVTFFSNPFSWLELMSKEKATHSIAPNFAYELCVERIDEGQLEKLDLSSIYFLGSGAEPVRYETINRFSRKFACTGLTKGAIKACYGLAEATLAVSTVRCFKEGSSALPIAVSKLDQDDAEVTTNQEFKPIVSCGTPFMTVSIVKPNTSQPVREGEVGEILIQGDSVAAGYWKKAEATRETFHAHVDGFSGTFLRTGDLGFITDDELFITGRQKDVIILRGRNIYPQDIELTVQKSWAGFRQGYGAAFTIAEESEDPKLIVVQEVERLYRRRLDAEFNIARLFREIREFHELDCYELVLVKPNNVSMTSSGKIQRRQNRKMYLNDDYAVLASFKSEDYLPQIALDETEEILEDRGAIASLVCRLIAHHTGMDSEYLKEDDVLAEYGFDSLMVTYLAQCLSKRVGRTIDAVWFLDTPTLGALIDRICGDEAPSCDCFAQCDSESTLFSMTDDPLLMVEGMSDDQIRLQFERMN